MFDIPRQVKGSLIDRIQLANVSVVICCYNSAKRLPSTLDHLKLQDVPSDLLWEVIVVDNASTDDTAKVALSIWPDEFPAPLRIVREPKLGLSHARKRGISEAQYEIVSFLDDDNWAGPSWIREVSRIMTTHPEVGACGGRTEAVTEINPPFWFSDYLVNYGIGQQSEEAGDITWSRGWLWGAGLSLRKKAWCELIENGFQPILSGRCGNKISSGEDVEICYAFRLSGWHLYYSDELFLRHFIPAERLTIDYLSNLKFGFGAQTIGFDPYYFYFRHKSKSFKSLLTKTWLWQLLQEIFIVLFIDHCLFKTFTKRSVKNIKNRTNLLWHFGRIIALWKNRNEYNKNIKYFARNKWIKIDKDYFG